MPRLLLILLALLSGAALARADDLGASGELSEYLVADSRAPEITPASLLANDRFWPQRATLVRPFAPETAGNELPAGLVGILIRVESPTTARIDFGRDGLYEVPIERTDLVAGANAVREGRLSKTAPNLALAIGPRLVETDAERPRMYSFQAAVSQRGFLSVFADPRDPSFDAIARGLSQISAPPGVLSVLFPQGRQPDPVVYEKLRGVAWRIPFVLAHLSEPYSRTLLREGEQAPFVALQTPDGRILFRSAWSTEAADALQAALLSL